MEKLYTVSKNKALADSSSDHELLEIIGWEK